MKFNIVQKKERKPLTIKTKYHVYFWWAAPLIPFCEFYDWANRKLNEMTKWDEEKAEFLLNKYILPKRLEYIEEENAYYYAVLFNPEWNYYRYCPRRYHRWLRKFGWKVQQYLVEEYENPDYTKTELREYDEHWIKFEERA